MLLGLPGACSVAVQAMLNPVKSDGVSESGASASTCTGVCACARPCPHFFLTREREPGDVFSAYQYKGF